MIKRTLNQSIKIICGLIFLFSCNFEDDFVERVKTDSEGLIIGKEPIWEHNSGNGKLIWPGVGAAVYDNHVVVAGNSGENEDLLLALDLDTGREKWRWNEFLGEWPVASFNRSEYGINQKDNLLLLSDGLYYMCIDISNGKTVWTDERRGMDITHGLKVYGENYYYGFGRLDNNFHIPQIIEGQAYTSDWQTVLIPELDSIQNFQEAYGFVGEVLLYEEFGDLIISFGFTEFVDIYQNQIVNYFSSYNLTQKKYIIEKLKIGEISYSHVNARPVLFGNIIVLNSNATFYGIDKNTGEIKWIKNDFDIFNGDGIFTFENYKNELIAINYAGPYARVMKIDPETGKTIWERKEEGGHAENIHIYRDILYFVDRGTGYLNAFDLNTGKRLWKISSPDEEVFSSFGSMAVIPSKDNKPGKLIVSSFLNTYCFKTER
ncbi:PQQ enzyme repeat-containing protein [Belliella baltica DSM 15883]|uniref:PQQ enzyme repeat-containing protein n=1 Tax=Belliella baltica (strain DSM 15883 / CIP 108006 / LMG 21964 / BA134) TaxID=866536 RepID=I3Z3B0_BELBD|nr:PQQ-binding-like beta-propeller repeat protein [Belliella baltica]AFL83728.1 PQQ enzyme repeat-containing protein [Belliella baltica DSM 15883]